MADVEVKTESVKSEMKLELSVLRKNSVRLFNVTSSTFDGAMVGQTGPLTVSTAKSIIERFKKGVAK